MDKPGFTESNHPALLYQSMLADEVRMTRYRQAIRQVVRPGDVVADLGAGTAVLALMAVQAGASRVYAIDNRGPSLTVAERIVHANHAGDRIRLVKGDARDVDIGEPVDVIVNELIGDFGTDENISECVRGFASRHLKPDGRIIPEQLRTWLLPVEYRGEFRGVWRQDFHGLDLRAALEFTCQSEPVMYPLRQRQHELAPAALVEDIRFHAGMAERNTRIELHFDISSPGTLQGFMGYFEATLTDGIDIVSYPCYPTCHWNNWNWPVTPPVAVAAGQHIEATLAARKNMVAAGWELDWQLRQDLG